nr:MAG TPA: hypothetical protein [Caudoviricetes sp.]
MIMNSLNMFNKEFPNGWGVNVKHNPFGFGDMYSSDYEYSVMVYNKSTGFTSFENIQYPSEVFAYIAKVMDW